MDTPLSNTRVVVSIVSGLSYTCWKRPTRAIYLAMTFSAKMENGKGRRRWRRNGYVTQDITEEPDTGCPAVLSLCSSGSSWYLAWFIIQSSNTHLIDGLALCKLHTVILNRELI